MLGMPSSAVGGSGAAMTANAVDVAVATAAFAVCSSVHWALHLPQNFLTAAFGPRGLNTSSRPSALPSSIKFLSTSSSVGAMVAMSSMVSDSFAPPTWVTNHFMTSSGTAHSRASAMTWSCAAIFRLGGGRVKAEKGGSC